MDKVKKCIGLKDLRVFPVGPSLDYTGDYTFPFVVFSGQTKPNIMAKYITEFGGQFILENVSQSQDHYYKYLSTLKMFIDKKYQFIPGVPGFYEKDTFDVLLLNKWDYLYCDQSRNWSKGELVDFVTSEEFKTISSSPFCIIRVDANPYTVQEFVTRGNKFLHIIGNREFLVNVLQKIKDTNLYYDINLMVDIHSKDEILPALALGVKKLNITRLLLGTDETNGTLSQTGFNGYPSTRMTLENGLVVKYRGSAFDVLTNMKRELSEKMCSLGAGSIEDLVEAPLCCLQGHAPWMKSLT